MKLNYYIVRIDTFIGDYEGWHHYAVQAKTADEAIGKVTTFLTEDGEPGLDRWKYNATFESTSEEVDRFFDLGCVYTIYNY